jgi:GNAT superfamily N-acetyltransferase
MADLPSGFRIRQATDADHSALKLICLQTGDSGTDASLLQDDPDVLGLVYAVPYQIFAPDFAFVLEDAGGPCGYVLGAPDTAAFETWMDEVWYPPLRTCMRNPGPDESLWRGSDWVRWRVFAPRSSPPVNLAPFPAHGHIDLLPRAQGKGLGRAMIQTLIDALRADGSPGLFLEVGAENTRAQAFYAHVGFRPLDRRPGSVIMAMRLESDGQDAGLSGH